MTLLRIINIPSHYNNIKEINHRLIAATIPVVPGSLRTDEKTNTATFITTAADIKEIENRLRLSTGHNDIRVEKMHAREKAPVLTRNRATYSVVIRGVHISLEDSEIAEDLRNQNLNISRTWRIKSKATGQMTMLVRVLTDCQRTVDKLLRDGAILANGRHRVEASHLPKPQPIQCGRCFTFDHHTKDCKQLESTCPKCGQVRRPDHLCQHVKCLLCGEEHEAWSNRCAKRPTNPVPEKTAPLKCPDIPFLIEHEKTTGETQIPVDEFATVADVIRFTTMTLANLFPEIREKILQTINVNATQYLRRKVMATSMGGGVHLAIIRNPFQQS